jgi:hypothetical protein
MREAKLVAIKVRLRNGVFEAIEDVRGVPSGQTCTAFSDDELRDRHEMLGWLKTTEKSFEFWGDEADASYDDA